MADTDRRSDAHPLERPAAALSRRLDELSFSPPVTNVYNTLDYAWAPFAAYLNAYGTGRKRVLLLGMNPGPWGMAQTGTPFGEIEAVRDWMGIEEPVSSPAQLHPKRPVYGFACTRREVSGKRLWGLMRERFGSARAFFAEHIVLNYCPLLFLETAGANRTPDKLKKAERAALFALCDDFLRAAIDYFAPACLVGIGRFAAERFRTLRESGIAAGAAEEAEIVQLPHPSPANPVANRDWSGAATEALIRHGVWRATDGTAPR